MFIGHLYIFFGEKSIRVLQPVFLLGCCFCCQSCVILTYLQFLLSKRHSSVNLHILYTWHTLSLCPEGTGHLGRHAMDIIPVLMGFQVYGGEVAASRAYSRVVPGSAGSMLSQGTLLQDAGCRARVGGRASCTLCFGDEVAWAKAAQGGRGQVWCFSKPGTRT